MNRLTVRLSPLSAVPVTALVALLACATLAEPAAAQRGRKGFPIEKHGMFEALHPTLVRPPISRAWKDPAALKRGEEMTERLINAAGGWEAYQELGGFRYDMLVRSKMNTGRGQNPWKVHHYEPRLVHLNVIDSGYVYSEWAKPSLTGPDFVREVKFGEVSWREMRGGYGRTDKSARTAASSVRMERLTATMPFSIRSMAGKLAFIRNEETEIGTLEVYALQLAETMMINYYPWMVDEYGLVDEFHLIVDPANSRVVQLRFAYPDETVAKAPYLRWWTMDFEGTIKVGEKCVLPHKRYRWLDEWNEITDLWIEDIVVERIPPVALRRPWQTNGVYMMPYRCDYWDPPTGVQGLTGHGTGVPILPAGQYPPEHVRSDGDLPPLPPEEEAKDSEGTEDTEAADRGEGAESPYRS